MATSKDYIDFLSEQFAPLGEVSFRKMMGEYLVYYRDKLAADVCDNRLFVKPVEAAERLLPDAKREPPYKGAKDMLLVEDVDNGEMLCELFRAMYEDLPAPKPKRIK